MASSRPRREEAPGGSGTPGLALVSRSLAQRLLQPRRWGPSPPLTEPPALLLPPVQLSLSSRHPGALPQALSSFLDCWDRLRVCLRSSFVCLWDQSQEESRSGRPAWCPGRGAEVGMAAGPGPGRRGSGGAPPIGSFVVRFTSQAASRAPDTHTRWWLNRKRPLAGMSVRSTGGAPPTATGERMRGGGAWRPRR